jgi:AcrR family transcriptional regulator
VGERERNILQAATELFFKKGFAAVGMDEIGTRAGTSGPAVYRHFAGKDEILATLFDYAIDGVIRATSGTFDDPYEELEHRVRGHADYVIKDQKLASVWIREDRSLNDAHYKRLRRRELAYIDTWTDNLERCYPAKAATSAARAREKASLGAVLVLSTLNSVAQWPSGTLTASGLAESLTTYALAGLRAFMATGDSGKR